MNISELTDLILARDALKLLSQCSVGESRKRAQEILKVAEDEIQIKSILRASGSKT